MKHLIAAAILVLSAEVSAQQQPTRIRVEVDVKATSAEQLQLAHDLMQKVDVALNDGDRQRATMIVLAHLQAVILKWPSDTRAVAAAYDMQYDLAMRSQMPMNAVEVMEKAELLSLAPGEKASIYRRKAKALAQSGRDADAETAYQAAEERQPHATPFERQAFLQDAARFASGKGRHAEAAKHLRKLANLPGLDASARMTTLLMSLEENVRAGDRAGARANHRDLQRLYDTAKSQSPSDDAEAEFLKIVADALERHRDG